MIVPGLVLTGFRSGRAWDSQPAARQLMAAMDSNRHVQMFAIPPIVIIPDLSFLGVWSSVDINQKLAALMRRLGLARYETCN